MTSVPKSKWIPAALIGSAVVAGVAVGWPLGVDAVSSTRQATPAVVGPASPAGADATEPQPEPTTHPSPEPPASPSAQPEPQPSVVPAGEGRSDQPSPVAGRKADDGPCTNTSKPIVNPTRFVVSRMGVDVPMMNVGKDANGNPGAPPKSAAYAVAWYNRSSEVASDKGNVMLTAHTYRNGHALGNDLVKSLQPGDVIKISDRAGNRACYTYTGKRKVDVKTYDSRSGWFYNPDGPAQLALMVCWDRNAATGNWDSRYIFYASLQPA